MKRNLYIICVCLLSILIVAEWKENRTNKTSSGGQYVPTAFLFQKVQQENQEMQEEKKIAYLTFDDGPSEVTPVVLDTLKKRGVKATFFLVGEEITKEREEIVKRTKADGHAIGVHTNTHKQNQLYSSYDGFFEDFKAAKEKIDAVTGQETVLHRFPWGSNNNYLASFYSAVKMDLEQEGIMSYDWNVSGEDSFNNGVSGSQIYQNVKKNLGKYNTPIILLHDSNMTKNTALILGDIIDMIKSEGYEFDTLDNRKEYIFPDSRKKMRRERDK